MLCRIALTLLLLVAAPLAVCAETLQGRAVVTDGDTLHVQGQTVRLFGIDAPERSQTCDNDTGQRWACGLWAKERLATLIGAQSVTCQGDQRDRYARLVAHCTVAGRDVGQVMVRIGAAEAYRTYALDYVGDEKAAMLARAGVWQGRREAPADYRAAERATGDAIAAATETAQGECRIKGNISSGKRIYHLPGQADYAATRINPRSGEQWFCSEAAARAAGWRRAAR